MWGEGFFSVQCDARGSAWGKKGTWVCRVLLGARRLEILRTDLLNDKTEIKIGEHLISFIHYAMLQ
jgi:hypothetical protein